MSYLPIVLVWLPVVYFTYKILHRMGFNPWWCLLAFIPVVNLIGLWRLSRIEWPALQARKDV